MDWECATWGLSVGFLVGLGFGQWGAYRLWRQTAKGISLKNRQPVKSAGDYYYVVTSEEFLNRMQR